MEFVIPGWTVAAALALIDDVAISLRWTGWAAQYFSTPAPADPETVLRLHVAPDSAMLRGYATEYHDAICEDWIEIIVDVQVSTDDGILEGSTDAKFVFNPSSEETAFDFTADAAGLNLITTWPASEERPVPNDAILRLELAAPQLSLDEQSTGELWLHWVWISTDGSTQRTEELSRLATID